MTADTLKRLARTGKLVIYRPGKQHLSTLANVWEMIQATRTGGPRPASNLSAVELSHAALEQAREALRRREEQRIEDEWERLYDARKAAQAKARPPRDKR